jgi:hypothetical protein
MLLAGQVLPIPPSGEKPTPGGDDAEAKDLNAFFSAGYDYKDAVRLAKIWKSKTAYDAKVEGGKRLLAGQTLPFAP